MEIYCSYSKLIDVEKLTPNPKNTNKHPKKQIKVLSKLIKANGIRHPIIVSNRSGFIVAGHGRREALILLGIEQAPVDYQDFETEADEYRFLESDNHIAEFAEHDQGGMLKNLEEMGIDVEAFDFEEFGIIDFKLPEIEECPPGGIPDDEVPDVKESRVKRGDIWKLGNHRLMCGDSTMIDDVEMLMAGEKMGMVHTDPPYNIAYEGGSKKREKIANDNSDDFNLFLSDVYQNYNMVMYPGACIYVWHASFETHNFIREFLGAGFLYKSYIIWNKNNSTFGRSDYHWKHEPCVYGWKDGGGAQMVRRQEANNCVGH